MSTRFVLAPGSYATMQMDRSSTVPPVTGTDGSSPAVGYTVEAYDNTLNAYVTLKMVRNTSGGALVAGLTYIWETGGTYPGCDVQLPSGTANDKNTIAGVAVYAVPDSSWGFVVCKGPATVTSNAAITAAARLRLNNTAGKLDDDTSGAAEGEYFAQALTAATGADTSFTASINLP